MATTAPTQYQLVNGPSGQPQLPALVYADSAGSLANVTTPWVLSGGIYVPWPVGAGTPQVALAGTLAPLASSAYTLVDTIPYGDLGTAGPYVKVYSAVLARNARGRNVTLISTLDQALSVCQFQIFDSQWQALTGNPYFSDFMEFPHADVSMTAKGSAYWASTGDPAPNVLTAPWDSLAIALNLTTGPASGNVYVLVYAEL